MKKSNFGLDDGKAMNIPHEQIHELLMDPTKLTDESFQDLLTHITYCHKCQIDAEKIYKVASTVDLKAVLFNKLLDIHPYWTAIRDNLKLRELENAGFKRGGERGKTMNNVTIGRIFHWLIKQWNDLVVEVQFEPSEKAKTEMLQKIADLRNVAGLMFILIDDPKIFDGTTKEESTSL